MQTLTMKEEENLFLDIWFSNFQESYDTLWYEGIEGDWLISDCAKVYPKLYKSLLGMMEKEARREGVLLR